MKALNASRLAVLSLCALASFSSHAVAQKRSHERSIERKESAKETPRAPQPQQQAPARQQPAPQKQSPAKQQAPAKQEPAPPRAAAPSARPTRAPAPSTRQPAPPAREEQARENRGIPAKEPKAEPAKPQARIEEFKPSRERANAASDREIRIPARHEETPQAPAATPGNRVSLPTPIARKSPPSLETKKDPGVLIKPAPVHPRTLPKALTPYYGQRFQAQLPKPAIPQASTGSQKSHGSPYKKCWNPCKLHLGGCSPYLWIPSICWIPMTIYTSVEIPCMQSHVVEVQEVVLEEPVTLELDAVEKAVRLGDLYFRAGKYDKAAASYMEAIALSPEQAELYFLLSDALFAVGDFHFAAYCIRTALELDVTLARSEADKRSFYGNRDDFYRHLRVLEKYLEEFPEDADAELVLAYNRQFSQDPAGAKRALIRVLEIQEDAAARVMLEAMTKR